MDVKTDHRGSKWTSTAAGAVGADAAAAGGVHRPVGAGEGAEHLPAALREVLEVFRGLERDELLSMIKVEAHEGTVCLTMPLLDHVVIVES